MESYVTYSERVLHKRIAAKTGNMVNNNGSEPKSMPGLRFGLFSRIHDISFKGDSPRSLFDW